MPDLLTNRDETLFAHRRNPANRRGGRVRLARKHSDLQKHADFWAHLNAIHEQSRRGEHDTTAHGVLADHIGEMVGNPDDPRALLVRSSHPVDQYGDVWIGRTPTEHGTRYLAGALTEYRDNPDIGPMWSGLASPEAYKVNAHTSMRLLKALPYSTGKAHANKPIVQWTLHVPRTRAVNKKSRTQHFTRIFNDANELHDFIDKLPKQNRVDWAHTARLAGWERTDGKPHANDWVLKLAAEKKPTGKRPTPLIGSDISDPLPTYSVLPASGLRPTQLPAGMRHLDEKRSATPAVARPSPTPPELPHIIKSSGDKIIHGFLAGRQLTRSDLAQGQLLAEAAEIEPFMAEHGYTDEALARRHLGHIFTRALHDRVKDAYHDAEGIVYPHPLSGKSVHIVYDHRNKSARLASKAEAEEYEPTKLARKKLARTRVDGAGSAAASAGSKNHDARLMVVRETLKEAGLSPSVVRAALAHDGGKISPAFAGAIRKAAHPDHLLYTAAWVGLLTGQKRLAVVHPDSEGEDFLHVISAPGHPDRVTSALRGAGVEKFTTERTPAGTRAFVLNPLGKYPVERVVKGIPNARHSVSRVRVYRIGSGSSADPNGSASRSNYRSIIDGFERAAGYTPTASNASTRGPAGNASASSGA